VAPKLQNFPFQITKKTVRFGIYPGSDEPVAINVHGKVPLAEKA